MQIANTARSFVFAASLSAAVTANAQSAEAVRKELQTVYNKINTAGAQRDTATLLNHYAPDYKGTLASGRRVTYADLRVQIPQFLRLIESMKAASKVLKVTRKGTAWLALVRSHAEIRLPNPKTGKPSLLVIDSEEEDTWMKVKGKWLNTLGKTLKSKETLDGKPALTA